MGTIGNKLLLAGVLVLALSAGAAYSQSQDPRQDSRPDLQQNSQQNQQSNGSLEDRKKKMTLRIQDRISKLQKSLDCVKNAQDSDALHACLPERGDRSSGKPGMKRGGWGGSDRSDSGGGY